MSSISVHDPETIVSFGGEVAEEISRCSDMVLRSMNMAQINDTGEMLTLLGKIMEKFDIDEIRENPGFFQKLFVNLKKQLEKNIGKIPHNGRRSR